MTNEIIEMNLSEMLFNRDERLLHYIINLQEENERINKAIDYGSNCLENLKDQEDYLCESIDIVSLLRMIHKNYIDILQGEDNEKTKKL